MSVRVEPPLGTAERPADGVRVPPGLLRRRVRQGRRLLPYAATFVAVLAWLRALGAVDWTRAGDLGLITALTPSYFLAVGLLSTGFVLALLVERSSSRLLAVQVLLWIVMLHGTVSILQPEPRFPMAWLHAGFTEYIARSGATLPVLDARFSWPGFFSGMALLASAAGVDSPVAFLRWAPVAFNILYLIPLVALLREVTTDTRTRWLALWLFYTANWVGQDYYSPQALVYILLLASLLITVRWFRPGDRRTAYQHASRLAPRVNAWLLSIRTRLPDELAVRPAPARHRVFLILLLTGLLAVMVVTHQLTPVSLIGTLIMLVLAGSCRLRLLPVILIVLLAGWVSYGAVAFWSGHIDALFGTFGQLAGSVQRNVSGRLDGSGARMAVLGTRLAFAAVVGLLAAVGFLCRVRRGRGDLTFAVLAGSPFLVLAANSYGGEALLRAYFFALPFLAFFAASIFTGRSPYEARALLRAGGFLILSVVLVPAFLVARYGNERYEMVTPHEAAAFSHFYDNAPTGATLATVSTEVPWRFRSIEAHDHTAVVDTWATDEFRPSEVSDLVAAVHDLPHDSWLVVTRGQEAYGELALSLPTGWAQELTDDLVATGRFDVVYANEDARILRRPSPPEGVHYVTPEGRQFLRLEAGWWEATGPHQRDELARVYGPPRSYAQDQPAAQQAHMGSIPDLFGMGGIRRYPDFAGRS